MKAKILTLIMIMSVVSGALCQDPVIFTFSAVNNQDYVQLDSVKIINRTQGGDTMVYWPTWDINLNLNPGDLMLFVGYATFPIVNVPNQDLGDASFSISQNYPNPMAGPSDVSMYIPHPGKVDVFITDLYGQVVVSTDRQLGSGYHSFRFKPGDGSLYLLTAIWNGMSRSIQMISTGQPDGANCRLDYVGPQSGTPVVKTTKQTNDFVVKESGILDRPDQWFSVYTFQFATNIPCPWMETVEWGGQVYNTIQIFSQCWLKENLNIGSMISSYDTPTNNEMVEKYCFINSSDSCAKYGGLYTWDEMMQYSGEEGVCGICPPGWHLPTDEEWKVMEGATDTYYGIGDTIWDIADSRGEDLGMNLKATHSWYLNGNGNDRYDFTGLPGSERYCEGFFSIESRTGFWWTSTMTESDIPWHRHLGYNHSKLVRGNGSGKNLAKSVRCIRDY